VNDVTDFIIDYDNHIYGRVKSVKEMHVLHYVPNFHNPRGGREIFVLGLISHLQKLGIKQSVLTNSYDNKTEEISKFENDITVYSFPVKKFGAYQISGKFFGVLRNNNYSLINIHGYGEYAGDVVCILKKMGFLNVPLVLTTHGIVGLKNGYLAFDFSSPLSLKERIIKPLHLFYDFILGKLQMGSFDRIILHSEEEKKYLSRIGLSETKVSKLPIAINEIFFTDSSVYERNHVLYVGRIDPHKGLETLVKSIKELRSGGMDLKCIIIGQDFGYRSHLESIINQLEIKDLVQIKEFEAQENLLRIYGSAIVTVLPSNSEGFPLTLVESMACGTPFIATPVGIIPELVQLSKAGLLVKLGDEKNLAQSIKNLLIDKASWSEMSINGKQFAKNFTWKIIAKKYHALYSELIK